jgi:hypothetical protein
MRKQFVLPKEVFSTANRLSIKKMTALLVLILCFGISQAWGAKPGALFYVNSSAAEGGDGTSWASAFTDLQSALDVAVSSNEIWVAAGTYTPSKHIEGSSDSRMAAFILQSGVKIYGGFAGTENQLKNRRLDPGLTILSGDIGTPGDDTDNSYHVVYAHEVTDAVLDGFTVTLGRGEGSPYSIYNGAGMVNYESSLTVANCIFKDNQVAVKSGYSGYGGGMYNYNSAPIVTNCTFIGNRAGEGANSSKGYGGAMYNKGYFGSDLDPRWPVITGCIFRDNKRSGSSVDSKKDGGGGMYNDFCSPTVDRCTFADNYSRGHGGAMFNCGADPIITNCIFTGNYTYVDYGGGAMYNYGSLPKILNCTFYRNGWGSYPSSPQYFRPFTANGGAIFLYNSPAIIANTVFMENADRYEGGALYSQASSLYHWPTLYNCLFFENIRWNLMVNDTNKYPSHVYGNLNPDSVSNLYDIDPLLADPAGDDFRLRYDSPCIDSGTTREFAEIRWLPMPADDFYGDKRIVDGDGDGVPAADIGVYEFIPNLTDLGAFLQALADAGEIDEALAERLLDYVDAAQAALDQEEKETALSILNELMADVSASLGDTETAQTIEMKTEAVIEEI